MSQTLSEGEVSPGRKTANDKALEQKESLECLLKYKVSEPRQNERAEEEERAPQKSLGPEFTGPCVTL